MGVCRPIISVIAMVLTAGACLLMFLSLLGGVTNQIPLNQIYFLQADTANIPGAPSTSRWTMWNLCSVTSNGYNNCRQAHVDFPLDPPSASNFNTTVNVPPQFIGTNRYYLMTRFIFPFVLIALVLSVISLVTGILALCTRIGSMLSAVVVWWGWIFQTIATALMTAAYLMGRNNFNRNNQQASIGNMGFAFMWVPVGLLAMVTLLYCVGGRSSHRGEGYLGRGHFSRRRHNSTTRKDLS